MSKPFDIPNNNNNSKFPSSYSPPTGAYSRPGRRASFSAAPTASSFTSLFSKSPASTSSNASPPPNTDSSLTDKRRMTLAETGSRPKGLPAMSGVVHEEVFDEPESSIMVSSISMGATRADTPPMVPGSYGGFLARRFSLSAKALGDANKHNAVPRTALPPSPPASLPSGSPSQAAGVPPPPGDFFAYGNGEKKARKMSLKRPPTPTGERMLQGQFSFD
ncbi:hypothetical protein YB2330_003809 [Saitoella coloradoensis]